MTERTPGPPARATHGASGPKQVAPMTTITVVSMGAVIALAIIAVYTDVH